MLNYDGDNLVQCAVSHRYPDAKFPFQSLVNVTSVVRINNAEIFKSETYPKIFLFINPPTHYCLVTFQNNVVMSCLTLYHQHCSPVLFRMRDDDCCVQTAEQQSVRIFYILTDPPYRRNGKYLGSK